jgi:signal transduction histidine kinase/CheY-like chemotaxis protein
MKHQSIRYKLTRITVTIISVAVVTFMIAGIFLGAITSYQQYKQEKNRIEESLLNKGMTLVVNNSLALKGLAEDNAFSAIHEIVTSTVRNDSDMVYGIYMDNSRLPWVYASRKNPDLTMSGAFPLNDRLSIWAHTLKSPAHRQTTENAAFPGCIEFAAPVTGSDENPLGIIRYGITTERMHKAIIDELYNSIRYSILFCAAFFAIALIIFLFGLRYAWSQTKTITNPIEELSKSAEAIAHGDYSITAKVATGDEIETLANNFEIMRHTVKEYTGTLEQKVADRTKDLEDAQKELVKKAEKLSELKDKAEDATRAKSDFLANMSHEIRTPMNAVIGFGELLKNTSLDQQQKDYADTICASGELLISLINDILDMSKIESRKIALEEIDFDFEYLLGSVLKIVRQRVGSKPVDLNLLYPENVPRNFKGDPTRIRQIFLNLVGNSIKFTDKGDITISVAFAPGNVDGQGMSTLLLSVHDTGIGIPKNKQDLLFKAFSQVDSSITRKYGGTGLGLSITKSIVEMMGGTISVESEQGKGSSFNFSLRLKHGEAVAEKAVKLADIESLRGKKVVIVDDNAQGVEIVHSYCASAGMEIVLNAYSAKDALVWLAEENHAVDIILSDIMMPVMDGFAFARRILEIERLKVVKLVALTSDALPGSSDESDRAGFDAYLSKPFTRNELYNLMRAVFGDMRENKKQIITRHMTYEMSLNGVSVLVAEDNTLNQKLMGILLRQMGCIFDMANNGKEAMEKVREKKYDIILMDIQMPVMDGFEATRNIRNELKITTPIIALTARVFKEDEEKCREVGMNDFLTKPIETNTLKKKIINWVNT